MFTFFWRSLLNEKLSYIFFVSLDSFNYIFSVVDLFFSLYLSKTHKLVVNIFCVIFFDRKFSGCNL